MSVLGIFCSKVLARRVSSRPMDAHFWKKHKENSPNLLYVLEKHAFWTASFQCLAKSLFCSTLEWYHRAVKKILGCWLYAIRGLDIDQFRSSDILFSFSFLPMLPGVVLVAASRNVQTLAPSENIE